MKNINDIAQITGYSKSTISRALNNKGGISQETIDKVLKVAEELDYAPNKNAVKLSTGKSNIIGVITPYYDENSYYDTILHSILAEAYKTEYKIIFLPTNFNKETEIGYLNMLKTKEIDGVIILSAANQYDVISNYLKYGMIVGCEETGECGVSSIVLDRLNGYMKVLEYLNMSGDEHIGICFARTLSESIGAKQVFDYFKTQNNNVNQSSIFENCKNYMDGKLAGKYFSKMSSNIDVIFANSDEIAAGIIKFYEENHLNCPIIIGQENKSLGEFLNISSIDLKLHEIGSRALQVCVQGTECKTLIKSELIIRGE